MANNITKVYLLRVNLENDYKNTIYFASEAEQTAFFQANIIHTFTDFTYQRKDQFIRIPKIYDALTDCNYVMYQNSAQNNKWYYAFITDMKYVDDGRTDIFIETDVLQTWFFQIFVKPSFVEREHTSDDTIGANTVPEGLEMGEFVTNTHRRDTRLDNLWIVYGATVDVNDNNVTGGNYSGIYSGVRYYASESNLPNIINEVLKAYAKLGKADSITCLFLAPEFLVVDSAPDNPEVEFSTSAKEYDISYQKDYYMNGATGIRNNKLYTYPFNYLLVSNNNGAAAVYKYEYFSGNSVQFKVRGVLTPGCSVRMVPMNYKGTTELDEEGINLGKYPICNWASDVYTNWLTQNSVNIAVDIAADALQVIGGAVAVGSGAGAGVGVAGITNGITGIAKTLAAVHTQSFTPPQSRGNINCGDVITASNKNSFHFYNMSMKQEYVKIVDDYFTMFGYKTNRVKVPNYAHRARFWYTKTIDVNIDGAIPNKDMQIIKNAYNNGITFWRASATINDYTSPNPIV